MPKIRPFISGLAATTLAFGSASACLGDFFESYCNEQRPLQSVLPYGQQMADRHVYVSGWLNLGLTVNTDSPENKQNGPVAFNCRANEVHLHQGHLQINRQADIGQPGFSYGFGFDIFFGTDSHFASADEWDDKWNISDTYGFAVPQRYGELANGSLSLIAGHFYTLVGYETVAAPSNFFYSHSYTANYAEPFTHTGILATYHGFEDSTIYGGWTSGWDAGLSNDVGGNPGFLGGLTVYISDYSTVSLGFTLGNHPIETEWDDKKKGFRSLLTGTVKTGVSDNIRLVTHAVYGRQDKARESGAATNWYGFTQYLFYDINDTVSAGTRLEWLRDESGLVPTNGGCEIEPFGDRGINWVSWTNGVRVQACQHLVVRPEIRFDWATGGVQPFDSETSSSQFLMGVDAILTY